MRNRLIVSSMLLGFLWTLSSAAAQDLSRDIQILKRDISDLQRYIYNGQTGALPQSVTGAVTDSANEGASGEAMARLQVRLQDLERRFRDVTGQLEQAQFKARQLDQRLEVALKDIDFRLTALESGAAAPGSSSRAGTVMQTGQAASTDSQTSSPALSPVTQEAPPVQSGIIHGGAVQGTTVISSQGAQQPQAGTLGTLIVDAQGNVIGGQANTDATVGSTPIVDPQGAAIADPPPPVTIEAPAPVEGGDLASADGGTAPDLPESPQALYDYSLGLMRQGQHADAESALRVFLERHPQDDLVGAALYWLGETHYVRNNFRDAAFAFVDVYGKHKTSPKVPDSLLKLGMSLQALGSSNEACTALKTLKAEFPNARRAVLKLADERISDYGCS